MISPRYILSLSLWLSLQIGLRKIGSTKKHNTSGNGFTQKFAVAFINETDF